MAALALAPLHETPSLPFMHPEDMPDVYGMVCDGDCMEPYFKNGQTLLFSKSEPWKAGDPVLLFRRPETIRTGENPLIFKQLLSSPSAGYWADEGVFRRGNIRPMVMVRMVNPTRTLYLRADDLLGIHKCLTAPRRGH